MEKATVIQQPTFDEIWWLPISQLCVQELIVDRHGRLRELEIELCHRRNLHTWEGILALESPTFSENDRNKVYATGLQEWETAGLGEQLYIRRRNISNDIASIINNCY